MSQPADKFEARDNAARSTSNAPSGTQRALGVLKHALPLAQKLLPLVEGNVVTAVGNLLAPHTTVHEKVDLAPIHAQLNDVQSMQHGLRDQVAEQHAALNRLENQLEAVKEAADRNALAQQEMTKYLRTMGKRFNLIAALLLGLLVLSVILNFVLFMHIKRVLP